MDTPEQINPTQKYDRLAIASLVLGLTTLIFPIISVVYLVTANGGPGYLQSSFCGIPVALTSIMVGVVSLAQRKRNNPAGNWMAISGIALGSLFFVIALVMVFVLLFPWLSGTAG
jgi:uncharacterized membrane protein HdeD (DUF308 family)